MSDEGLIARLHLPWAKDANVGEVTLPIWVLELTAEAADRIEELQAKLAKAIEALDEAIYLLDPDEEDITKEAGLYRIVKAFKELKGEQP